MEDIPRLQGEVHENFGPDPSSSLGEELEQTDRQTDAPACFIFLDLGFEQNFFILKLKWEKCTPSLLFRHSVERSFELYLEEPRHFQVGPEIFVTNKKLQLFISLSFEHFGNPSCLVCLFIDRPM